MDEFEKQLGMLVAAALSDPLEWDAQIARLAAIEAAQKSLLEIWKQNKTEKSA